MKSLIVGDVKIIYLYIFVHVYNQKSREHSRLERHSKEREIVGSSPAVVKNFSFCNPRSLSVIDTSNQPIQMKSTVTNT